jgi:hypothetical protein
MNHTQITTKFVQKLAYIFRMTGVASDSLMRLLLYGYLSVASNAAVDIHSFFFQSSKTSYFIIVCIRPNVVFYRWSF